MGNWDQFDDDEDDEETGAEGAEAEPDDNSEEDAAFRAAMEMADAVKGGWGAREQLEACLAVAEAALLSKAAKAQRREQAEEERWREARERAMAEKREREEREAREIVAAQEREALRVRREREARQSSIPAAPAGPSAEELRRRERERQVAAEERAAKVRLANAQAAEIEAKAELMRAQARATADGRAREAGTAGTPAPPARIAPVPTVPLPRVALRRPQPLPLKARVVEPSPGAARAAPVAVVADPPRAARIPDWTGGDLACLRAERHLSQRELAALMGVGHGMVAKAEVLPGKPLGAGMAAAFTKVALPSSATRAPP
jgi:hypothetical protein